MENIGGSILSLLFNYVTSFMDMMNQKEYQNDQYNLQQESNDIAQDNVKNNYEVANKNLDLQKMQYEYQKQLNQLQMDREDTAMQRQVSDLRKAGLSPLMVSGGAQTGNLVSASAPQMDMSGINSAISNLLGVKSDFANRKQNAYQFQRQIQLQTAKTYADLQQMKLNNKKLSAEIEGQEIENDYNRTHGTRDPNFENAIVDAISRLIEDRKISVHDVNEALDNAKQTVKEKVMNAIDNSSPEKIKEAFKENVVEPTLKSLSNGGNAVVESSKTIGNKAFEIWKKTPIYKGYKKVQKVYQNYKNK